MKKILIGGSVITLGFLFYKFFNKKNKDFDLEKLKLKPPNFQNKKKEFKEKGRFL